MGDSQVLIYAEVYLPRVLRVSWQFEMHMYEHIEGKGRGKESRKTFKNDI